MKSLRVYDKIIKEIEINLINKMPREIKLDRIEEDSDTTNIIKLVERK